MDNIGYFLPHDPEGKLDRLGSTVQRWEVDTARSSLTFNLSHLLVRRVEGCFTRWGGTLFIHPGQPGLSNVEIWVDLSSVTTDDSRRDAHVVSSEFFDVSRYPRAIFRSTSVDTPDGELWFEGLLSLHGIACPVQVQVDVEKTTIDPDGRPRVSCGARCVVDRQSFKLHWDQDLDTRGIVVGDSVEIRARLEAVCSTS